MNPSRLTVMHMNIIGGGVLLVVALILFFFMIRPTNQQVEAVTADADNIEKNGGTQQAIDSANKELKKQQAQTKQFNADWAVYSRKYMPDFDWKADPLKTYEFVGYANKGFITVPERWGMWITQWYAAQSRDGIHTSTPFSIPALAPDPNSIANLTSITIPGSKPWHVTVIANNFNAAVAHLRRFNSMTSHGMPVVNNVTLSGQSPNLQMDYDLALYIIPNTPPTAADSRIGGAGGAGGGKMGGFPGGPMSGGMPPMAPGGVGK